MMTVNKVRNEFIEFKFIEKKINLRQSRQKIVEVSKRHFASVATQ